MSWTSCSSLDKYLFIFVLPFDNGWKFSTSNPSRIKMGIKYLVYLSRSAPGAASHSVCASPPNDKRVITFQIVLSSSRPRNLGYGGPADTLTICIAGPPWPFPAISRTLRTHGIMGTVLCHASPPTSAPSSTTTNICSFHELQWPRSPDQVCV